jgi:hypothetical protein
LVARSVDIVTFAFLMAVVYVEFVHRVTGAGSDNLFDAGRGSQVPVRLTFFALSGLYELLPVAVSVARSASSCSGSRCNGSTGPVRRRGSAARPCVGP